MTDSGRVTLTVVCALCPDPVQGAYDDHLRDVHGIPLRPRGGDDDAQ